MAFSNIFSRPARLVLSATVFLSLAQAHTVMTTLYVDGENQGDGVCIRMNMDGYTSNYFVSPVTSKDIACGRAQSPENWMNTWSSLAGMNAEQCRRRWRERRVAGLPCQNLLGPHLRIPRGRRRREFETIRRVSQGPRSRLYEKGLFSNGQQQRCW